MKKFFKKAAVIGLAGALSLSALGGLVGCGSKSDITVYIFAGEDDVQTNTDLCNRWAENYKARMIESGEWTESDAPEVKVTPSFDSDTATYFTTIGKKLSAGNAQDIFYVSPKYVKAWSRTGMVLDLSKYIDFSAYDISDVWGTALGFYGYDAANNVIGETLEYDAATNTFKNPAGGTSGVYGLPKDLSSFGLAFNANYFTEDYQKKYETTSAASFGDPGTIMTADGKDAPGVMLPGQTITYKPYNFYMYENRAAAVAAGDPVALQADSVNGYSVTLPGYPGDTFEIKPSDQVQGVDYDASIGYTTFTYAEYSAITWAATYYLYKASPSADHKITNSKGDSAYVYGNDMYEGSLYLLPWLAGNDADYISADFTTVRAQTLADDDNDGKPSQTGVDSENFMETYAAFLAYTSDWNGNSYYAGDNNLVGGWDGFNGGYVLFYGCGTWDMTSLNNTDKVDLDYQVMPVPISEDFALNSTIKDYKYEPKHYGTTQTSFTEDEIYQNQLKRQNQWATRLDSVGYGANGKLEQLVGTKDEWKIAAVADLVAYLTIDPDTQVQLTYAGSQLPNYASQCQDYLYYMDSAYQTDGAFRYMITPDNTKGNENPNNPDYDWDTAYSIAKRLRDENDPSTVSDYMKANYPTYQYNRSYDNYKVSEIGGISLAMRVLNMISYNYESRNLMLRMESGVNGVRDSGMYTYSTVWLDRFAEFKVTYLIAYCQHARGELNKLDKGAVVENSGKYYTPYEYCKWVVDYTQSGLDESIQQEQDMLG